MLILSRDLDGHLLSGNFALRVRLIRSCLARSLVVPRLLLFFGPRQRTMLLGLIVGLARVTGESAPTVDESFNANGAFLTGPRVRTIVVQPDGKLLVGGFFTTSGGSYGLMRLNSNGSPDAGFKAVLPSFPTNGILNAVVVQEDANILVGGSFTFARLRPDGAFDPTFTQRRFAGYLAPTVEKILLQSDGRILIGGNFWAGNGIGQDGIARFKPDGSFDESFASFPFTNRRDSLGGLMHADVSLAAQTADGKILVAGGFVGFNGFVIAGQKVLSEQLISLTSDGKLDRTFSYPGGISALAAQPDGKILLGTPRGLERLNPDGLRDESFKPPDPAAAQSSIRLGIPTALLVESDGKILFGGALPPGTNTPETYARFARLHPSASLDTVLTAAALNGDVFAIARQRDGKILLGGAFTQVGAQSAKFIARLVLDDLAAPPVIVSQPANQSVRLGEQAAFIVTATSQDQPDIQWQFNGTNIVAATNATLRLPNAQFFQAGAYRAFVRNTSGAVTSSVATLAVSPKRAGDFDFTFDPVPGVAGVYIYSPRLFERASYSAVHSLWVQPDQRIVISGNFTNVGGASRLGVARLLRDGKVDLDFVAPRNLFDPEIQRVFLTPQADGKILIWGILGAPNLYPLVRLNPDGSPDRAFVPSAEVRDRIVFIKIVAAEPGGRLLVAGNGKSIPRQPSALAFVRLSEDGRMLKDFAADYPQLTALSALYVKPDGQILASATWSGREGLLRFNPDGSLNGDFVPIPPTLQTRYVRISWLAEQSTGKFLISDPSLGSLDRLNEDGSIDTSFRKAPEPSRGFTSLFVQPDDKILIGGLVADPATGASRPVLARLNADGELDATFAIGSGARHAEPGLWPGAYALGVQSDGAVVIGGRFDRFNGVPCNGVARLIGFVPEPGLFSPILIGTEFRAFAPTLTGKSYTLESRTSLNDSVWSTVSSLPGDGTVKSFVDQSSRTQQRFYRLRVE